MTKTPPVDPTSNEDTGSLPSNTTYCTNANRAVAQFAYELLKSSTDALPLIITIRRAKFGASSAITATIESSGDIRTATFSDEWLTTSKEEPAGSSRRKSREREKRKSE
jgi:hypothetical protein